MYMLNGLENQRTDLAYKFSTGNHGISGADARGIIM